METPKITVVITSCNRMDLLENSIDSFLAFNTYPLSNLTFMVVEDSGIPNVTDALEKKYAVITQMKGLADFTWLKKRKNRGYINSVDMAYSLVQTPYIFHMEDDWQFYRSGFIEKSLDILEADPKIMQVWLRERNDTNGHPVEPVRYHTMNKTQYNLVADNYEEVWGGFSLNPGLRRTEDQPIEWYKTANRFNPKYNGESGMSIYFQQLGMRAAILTEGYVRHIGAHQHINQE